VTVADWVWFAFTFAFGCCIGSFLNVVIYRLPKDQSLVKPPSSCPACGRRIRFYDNIPLVSWLVLGAKCRYCKAHISAQYFLVELLTGTLFLGLYILYFQAGLRMAMPAFLDGGWLIYLISITLLAALIAASAIDLKLWVIPLSICWFATAAGLVGSTIAGHVIEPDLLSRYRLLPRASAATGALALGAVSGLAISLILLGTGLIKRSYESEASEASEASEGGEKDSQPNCENTEEKPASYHRIEACREIPFLLPVIVCSVGAYWILPRFQWWAGFAQNRAVAGLLGGVWGYFVGCGVVWATRILGTLGFGKEAMGLGDVHLMGAAGTVVGPVYVVVAFFIAPFFGLVWAGCQMFFKKCRQIPYGPFLSLGVFTVMILHDWILSYWNSMFR